MDWVGFSLFFGVKFQRHAVNLYLTDVSHVQDNSASGKKEEMAEYCNQHVVVYCTVNSDLLLVYFSWKRLRKTSIHVPHHLIFFICWSVGAALLRDKVSLLSFTMWADMSESLKASAGTQMVLNIRARTEWWCSGRGGYLSWLQLGWSYFLTRWHSAVFWISMIIKLITHWCFRCCLEDLTLNQGLFGFPCSVSEQMHKK